jgi:1-deoxy-D-xylulose-5-phosphate reductoisomerase
MNYPQLTFEKADTKTFRNLALAFHAMNKGGNSPCVLNAANEIAVEAFLKDRIGFLEMSDLVEKCLQTVDFIGKPSYTDYVATDKETREVASRMLKIK